MAAITKAQKRAQEYRDRARIALTEAAEAGTAAAVAKIATMEKSPEGLVKDACGYGSVTVHNPSYPLREALKALGAVRNFSGSWHFLDCPPDSGSQSITVNEVSARAACEVLRRHFPNDGEFIATSRMD